MAGSNRSQDIHPQSACGSPAAGGPKAPGADLKRSWVEDVASAPSWTEQEKDPGASTLGMSAPNPSAFPEQGALAAARPMTASDPRVVKAPQLRKARRSGIEMFLVVTAIVVIVVCLALALYVLVFMK